MSLVPLLLAGALFLVAIALGFHCLLLHCDAKDKRIEPRRDSDSASRRPSPR